METEPHRSQINTHKHTLKNVRAHSHSHTPGYIYRGARARRHVHTLNTSRPSHERKGGKREREANMETERQTDKDLYLFVHFDVEAVRHLVVLRRKGSDG